MPAKYVRAYLKGHKRTCHRGGAELRMWQRIRLRLPRRLLRAAPRQRRVTGTSRRAPAARNLLSLPNAHAGARPQSCALRKPPWASQAPSSPTCAKSWASVVRRSIAMCPPPGRRQRRTPVPAVGGGRSAQRNCHSGRTLRCGAQCNVGSAAIPQHFLNFLPEPQGQGSLRPTFVDRRGCSRCGSGRSGSCQ
jgi:hypothetical protein